jgi:hypothetical protein
MGTCYSCPPDDNVVPDGDMVDHLRLMHPDEWGDGLQEWPDGEPVIVDHTLKPDDFGSTDG